MPVLDDAARLRDALGRTTTRVIARDLFRHRVSYPLRDLFLRHLRLTLVMAEQLADWFLRLSALLIVQQQLQQLREQGLVINSATRHLGEPMSNSSLSAFALAASRRDK